MLGPFRILACALGAALLAASSPAAAADTEVDLELVLAVDISFSMDLDELDLQRQGYMAALVSEPVLKAIRTGIHGRIALAYVEWAGTFSRRTVVDWQIVDGPESAADFAARLGEASVQRAHRTSIAGALLYAMPMFENNGYEGIRRVIDISGDGVNNQGPLVVNARDEVLARGIVINGLPLLLKRQTWGLADIVDLDLYYRDCVIGGPGSFMVPVRERSQFAEAIRTKLILEIAGRAPTARIMKAAATPSVSCTIGEQQWMERFGP
jgi:hypothetical protein